MREIKLIIQNEEDIVFLEQGLNWIRQHILKSSKDLFDLMKQMNDGSNETFKTTIESQIESYDRIMNLIAQLDRHLNKKSD